MAETGPLSASTRVAGSLASAGRGVGGRPSRSAAAALLAPVDGLTPRARCEDRHPYPAAYVSVRSIECLHQSDPCTRSTRRCGRWRAPPGDGSWRRSPRDRRRRRRPSPEGHRRLPANRRRPGRRHARWSFPQRRATQQVEPLRCAPGTDAGTETAGERADVAVSPGEHLHEPVVLRSRSPPREPPALERLLELGHGSRSPRECRFAAWSQVAVVSEDPLAGERGEVSVQWARRRPREVAERGHQGVLRP